MKEELLKVTSLGLLVGLLSVSHLSLVMADGSTSGALSTLHVIKKGEKGNLVEVRLPSQNGGFDTLEGLLLPMAESTYEGQQIGKFKEGWIRLVTTQAIRLNRVAGAPPKTADPGLKRNVLLGAGETFATNWHFRGLSDAMKSLALLPEWYKQFGVPQLVVEILVPKGTEMYIGHAEEQKTAEDNAALQVRTDGKKKRADKKIYNVSAGGGIQLMIPRKAALTGGDQLGLDDILNTYPLKNDLQDKGGYSATNVQKLQVAPAPRVAKPARTG